MLRGVCLLNPINSGSIDYWYPLQQPHLQSNPGLISRDIDDAQPLSSIPMEVKQARDPQLTMTSCYIRTRKLWLTASKQARIWSHGNWLPDPSYFGAISSDVMGSYVLLLLLPAWLTNLYAWRSEMGSQRAAYISFIKLRFVCANVTTSSTLLWPAQKVIILTELSPIVEGGGKQFRSPLAHVGLKGVWLSPVKLKYFLQNPVFWYNMKA